jgi:hypothetical protein
MKTIYGAVARHVLSAVGGALVLLGVISQEDLSQGVTVLSEFAGAAFVAGSFIWSIYRKIKDGQDPKTG